jgi:hypothetical protein
MTNLYQQKMTAEMDGNFVVFLIGMRINKPWKIHKWLPVYLAMPRMLKELSAHPESGLLGYRQMGLTFVQYWRSFEQLEAYARNKTQLHLPAWQAFYKCGGMDGDVGIWHETYCVSQGQYEAMYGNMPAFGLGKVGRLVPASGRKESARGRMEESASSCDADVTLLLLY